MNVLIQNWQSQIKIKESFVQGILIKALRELSWSENCEVSVVFTNNQQIKELNKKYRKVNKPTDVLAFYFSQDNLPFSLLGDIVISTDMVQSQAKDYGVSFLEELSRLLIHGLLHLLGYEDDTEKKAKGMHKKQEELLKSVFINAKIKMQNLKKRWLKIKR